MSSPASQLRRSSLGMLLRRSKSGDLKKQQAAAREQERQRDAVSKSPPRLPVLYNGAPAPQLELGGPSGEVRPDSLAILSGRFDQPPQAVDYTPRPSIEPSMSIQSMSPPPPVPVMGSDHYGRVETMTHRGRYSYASSSISTLNSPRRVRRRKDPTPFNILIIGSTNAGKTSFLEFLKTALALPPKKRSRSTLVAEEHARPSPVGAFIPHYLESEMDGERIGLTLWDSEGLEKNVVDLQLREMSTFLESKFEETFNEEMKVVRSPGVQDSHIHATFLLLDPARLDRNMSAGNRMAVANGKSGWGKSPHPPRLQGGLDEDLDLQVLRTLHGKTTVIPVISKADTITTKHMDVLKRSVWDSLKKADLDPLEALGLDDDGATSEPGRIEELDEGVASDGHDEEHRSDEDDVPVDESNHSFKHKRLSSSGSSRWHKSADENTEGDAIPFIPMTIISPDIYEPDVIGRKFPWGFADPNNEQHCDFLRLKESVFCDWRSELREASREQWYEGWRTSRLKQREIHKIRR